MNKFDILVEIFNFVDCFATLQRCKRVCRLWNDAVSASKHASELDLFKKTSKKCKNLNQIFLHVCAYGQLESAKFIHKTYGITYDDEDGDEDLFLFHTYFAVCLNGHLEVAKWIHETFSPDLHDDHPELLSISCQQGHLELAKWLVQTFDLTGSHITDTAFDSTERNGHHHVIDWIAATFPSRFREIKYWKPWGFGRSGYALKIKYDEMNMMDMMDR
jgi:hypothetical protein